MKNFINENFLLQNSFAENLYHQYAVPLPVIDYHNHLPPAEIAHNMIFDNLAQVWLSGDHYKWRAMRTMGIEERFITGEADDAEKFSKWAYCVPYTLRNPLYHWTHLELKRYFAIDELLNPETAGTIYGRANEILQTKEFSVRNLLTRMQVEVLCTTDDPIDDLEYHRMLKVKFPEIKILPAFRPDKALDVGDPQKFNDYLQNLEDCSQIKIINFDTYLEALEARHEYFHQNGCRLADHGLEQLYTTDYSINELETIFRHVRRGKFLLKHEVDQFKSAVLIELARFNHARGWIQQYHLGALRSVNSRYRRKLGPDTGFDSIGDFTQAANLARFFDDLEKTNQLGRTVLYNINPADNELFASMAGNFFEEGVKGKIQYGAAWWFMDTLEGMEKQINTLSNIGLLSCFIGMLTDSRSFLSFPRHEYFRRLLCNILGRDMQRGLIPHDMDLVGKLVQDVCYYNVKRYFGF